MTKQTPLRPHRHGGVLVEDGAWLEGCPKCRQHQRAAAVTKQSPIEVLRLLVVRTEIETERGAADGDFLPVSDAREALGRVETVVNALSVAEYYLSRDVHDGCGEGKCPKCNAVAALGPFQVQP